MLRASPHRRILAAAALLAVSAGRPASAWTEPTRDRMIRQAVELMPDSLRVILRKREANCLEGARAAAAGGPESAHRNGEETAVRERVERAAAALREIVAAIDRHESFRQIAFRFGEAAHLVADLDFPLNHPEAAGVGEAGYDRYRRFAEASMGRFTVVLDPGDPALLARGELEAYLESIAERAGTYGPSLEEVFRLEAEAPDPRRFDDRSVAFGIAALSYSRSVSNVSRVWLYVWEQANGDMAGAPFPLAPAEARR